MRGSTNIPMFLAFFRTPKHHLSVDAFLDIDRTVKATSRRSFMADTLAALGSSTAFTLGKAAIGSGNSGRRPRIAALTTIYHKYSHSEHIIDRFLEGYGWEHGHHRPANGRRLAVR